ncbi:hypothetical protein GCM10011495_29420 [Hymenobacter frigidus]|uniref:Secreted protein n=1 Tax=Hymenobacter frigidus TaxID=1524095 RepID=A0ABQ2ABF7_9BACT|nr:hypothetical protein [Hymenobacter frigidus]GGH88353.1 hypothetical protein GCM10011495_29420 [Hymenobacter frigidus]
MQKVFLLFVLFLAGTTTRAQELFYPAKYAVYKVSRSAVHAAVSNGRPISNEQKWNVKLLMVVQKTKKSGVYEAKIYNTTGDGHHRKITGPPVYTVTLFGREPRTMKFDNGEVAEIYSDTMYMGQLDPPENEVDGTTSLTPRVAWSSNVEGNKLLSLMWQNSSTKCSKDSRQHAKKCSHVVEFDCTPVE